MDLPRTRQSLLQRLSQRSDGAWHEFVEIYERAIKDFCRSKGLQESDTLDVCQEVLGAVDRHLLEQKHDSDRGSFRGWLFRVARNTAIDAYRRRARISSIGGEEGERMLHQISNRDEESAAFLNAYRSELVLWAAQQVKPNVAEKTWSCFWLSAIEQKNPQEVASELSVSVGSVYTAKCRVIARIRTIIRDLDIDEDLPLTKTLQDTNYAVKKKETDE